MVVTTHQPHFFHKTFFSNKNLVFLSTGTSFVIGAYVKNLKNINNKDQFNLLRSPDQKGYFYSQSFESKQFIKNLKNRKKNQFMEVFIKKNKLKNVNSITLLMAHLQKIKKFEY